MELKNWGTYVHSDGGGYKVIFIPTGEHIEINRDGQIMAGCTDNTFYHKKALCINNIRKARQDEINLFRSFWSKDRIKQYYEIF